MILASSLVAAGQTAPPNNTPASKTAPLAVAAQQDAEPGTASKTVKAESVTINMPEGMTSDQADAILTELKAIHQLLQNKPAAVAAAPAPAVNEKVKMSVGEGWHAMGREDAPVTLVEFTDYQCPFCRRFEGDTFSQLKKEYIDTGKVRFVSRDLPLDFHPNAPSAAMAARCAGDQGKFWEIRNAMMLDTATDLGAGALTKYAEKVALDMPAFNRCMSDKKYTDAIQKDKTDAGAAGISGTPSFVIGKSGSKEIDGERVVGAVPFSVFDTAIKDALGAK
jgi:protein-disulfide isomerase